MEKQESISERTGLWQPLSRGCYSRPQPLLALAPSAATGTIGGL